MLASAALAACAPTALQQFPAVRPNPADYIESLPPGFNAQHVKADLEGAVTERFGADALKRAQSAEGYVLSRHYQGLPQPTLPSEGPRAPIAALLILERGTWYTAEAGGAFRPLTPVEQRRWLTILADTGPWGEPTFAIPTCTDAGSTYLIASLPDRPFLLRAANCATPKSERLGLAAINL